MENFTLDIQANITVTVSALNAEDALAQVEKAFSDVPPVLLVEGEDVIYDFQVTGYEERGE
jgi:hypothetical protein